MTNKAIDIAMNSHGKQVDKAGALFIYHPLRVMRMARKLGLDEETQIIGVLHDVVEDTDTTLEDLKQAGFSERVINGVDAITRRDEESYFDFVRRVARNPDARKIKMIDNADNLRPERVVPGLKLVDRYKDAYRILKTNALVAGDMEFVKAFEEATPWIKQ